MTCGEIDLLIDGYLNGEIDAGTSIEIEEHISHCERCSRVQENYLTLRSVFQSEVMYHTAPARLNRRIRRAVQKETLPPLLAAWEWWRVPAMAALAVVVVVLIWRSGMVSFSSSGNSQIAGEVVDSHIRSLLVDHLTDVVSTDQHTVKPWFDGKTDFSPDVKNLDAQGFMLIGGRLDYIGRRVVPVVVYKRRQHIINLFSWPTRDNEKALPEYASTQQGYHVKSWQQSGVTNWAVSDVSVEDLDSFIRLLR